MVHRVFNFNPGPATLPLAVLERVQAEFLDYAGTGMSIMESSHRAPEFDAVNNSAIALLKELMGIPDDYHVLCLQGGASLQFAMVPMNLLPSGTFGDYILTGSWSKKAIKEANIVGKGRTAASTEGEKFTRIPTATEIDLDPAAQYVHMTSNNTIYGSQWHWTPDTGATPLVCDASSDILSKRIDASKFALIYAGAQKNLGPSGVTVVIIRNDLVEKGRKDIPTMLQYRTHAAEKSLYNTPNTFGIYFMKCYLEHVKENGGVAAVEEINRKKQDLLYTTIDSSGGFYRGTVQKDSRSWMNVPVRLPSEELEKKFLAGSKSNGLIGLKGHRSVGGIRASLYNAMPLAGVEALCSFMKEFQRTNG
jgi:phosphoserine aminotransferase